jgi:hypothetical protein
MFMARGLQLRMDGWTNLVCSSMKLLHAPRASALFDGPDDSVLTVLPSSLSDLVGAVRGTPAARGACESNVSSGPPALAALV